MPCIRICKTNCPKCHPEYDNGFGELRKIWEEWDLRILVLFILFTQLYLHFFGRRRRKSMARLLMNVNVWLLYLFSDLLATIALGKLSKLVKEDHAHRTANRKGVSKVGFPGRPDTIKTIPQIIRGLWAPVNMITYIYYDMLYR